MVMADGGTAKSGPREKPGGIDRGGFGRAARPNADRYDYAGGSGIRQAMPCAVPGTISRRAAVGSIRSTAWADQRTTPRAVLISNQPPVPDALAKPIGQIFRRIPRPGHPPRIVVDALDELGIIQAQQNCVKAIDDLFHEDEHFVVADG